MKIHNISVHPDALIGAPITSADGVEMGLISGVELDLSRHEVIVLITSDHNGTAGLSWDRIADCEISLQHPQWNRSTLSDA
tara:strand:- start:124 stop:366 length:243 start_codon:yes stop_codon:yes gene_type:complete